MHICRFYVDEIDQNGGGGDYSLTLRLDFRFVDFLLLHTIVGTRLGGRRNVVIQHVFRIFGVKLFFILLCLL